MNEPLSVVDEIQSLRLQILRDNITIDEQKLLLMRDIANTSLSQMRISAVEDDVKTNKEVAAAIAATLLSIKSNPFLSNNTHNVDHQVNLPTYEYIEGELSEVSL